MGDSCAQQQYTGSVPLFMLNVEPQKILKHRSLMNVNGMREGREKG